MSDFLVNGMTLIFVKFKIIYRRRLEEVKGEEELNLACQIVNVFDMSERSGEGEGIALR